MLNVQSECKALTNLVFYLAFYLARLSSYVSVKETMRERRSTFIEKKKEKCLSMLRHAPPDDFRPPAKNILLILITTKKVSRNTLSSLDLMRVNNSGHVSDDVIVKEKVTSEKGQ